MFTKLAISGGSTCFLCHVFFDISQPCLLTDSGNEGNVLGQGIVKESSADDGGSNEKKHMKGDETQDPPSDSSLQ
jgi:hypothetical protein